MRAGIFQCAGGGLTPVQRLDKLAAALGSARLDLIVCPELFMSGYNVGESINTYAEAVDGPFAGRVADLARASGAAIVYGYPEKAGDTIYNSAACFGPTGELIANHRKLVLPPGFEAQHFGHGNDLNVFELGGVRCAILVCYDAEHPETVRAAAEAGAQVVIVPTALVDAWDVVAFHMMPSRAFENGIWLLYANHGGTEEGARYLGASCIVGPDGNVAARAGEAEELICADLDIDRVAAAQARMPYLTGLAKLRGLIDHKNQDSKRRK